MHDLLLRRSVGSDADPIAPATGTPGRRTLTAGYVHRKERDDNGVADGADVAIDRASGSSGAALPGDLRGRFEGSLGADLSHVRVHTGAESADAADAVGAKAYTVGNDIHFGGGYWDPGSSEGQILIAHEVAHTVQQSGGAARTQYKLEVSSPGDALETEADHAASAMVTGAPAVVSGGSGVARKVMRDEATPAQAPAAGADKDAGGKCEVATEAEQQAARQAVLAAQAAASKALMDTALWTTDQFTKYISHTCESPAVFDPTLLGAGAKAAAGAAIGKIAGLFGAPGTVLKLAIGALSSAISGKIGNAAQGGKPPTPTEASSAGREAAKNALITKLSFIKTDADQQASEMTAKYQAALDAVGARFNEKADVKDVSDWAAADLAASQAAVPKGDTLYQSMLMTWVGNTAATPEGTGGDTNADDWKKACQRLFGRDDIPPQVFWALQARTEFANMGLSTAVADGWMASGAQCGTATAHFTTATDGAALAKAAGLDPSSTEGKAVAAGSGFTLDCTITTQSNKFGASTVYAECANSEYLLSVQVPPMTQPVAKNFVGKFIHQMIP